MTPQLLIHTSLLLAGIALGALGALQLAAPQQQPDPAVACLQHLHACEATHEAQLGDVFRLALQNNAAVKQQGQRTTEQGQQMTQIAERVGALPRPRPGKVAAPAPVPEPKAGPARDTPPVSRRRARRARGPRATASPSPAPTSRSSWTRWA